MPEFQWFCVKDVDNRNPLVFPKEPCEVVLMLAFQGEKGEWYTSYKRCSWNGTEFVHAPIKPTARAKQVFWRKVEEKKAITPERITERNANTVVWHPYPQEVPHVKGGGSFLLMRFEDGNLFLDAAPWMANENGFLLYRGRQSSILAWAFAPTLFSPS